jgi:hypothetical protein
MRINVYHEELNEECEVVQKTAETGIVYYGIRLFMKSAPELHFKPEDDDRTAITFWFGTRRECMRFQDAWKIGSVALSDVQVNERR